MRPIVVVLVIAGATACSLKDKDHGDDGGGHDGGGTATCDDLAARLHARAQATTKECVVPSECEAVGFPLDTFGGPTCNCGVAFASSCGGDPVNATAWNNDATARALLDEWSEKCVKPGGGAAGAPTICDCGPGPVSCFGNRCGASTHACFVVDAGPMP